MRRLIDFFLIALLTVATGVSCSQTTRESPRVDDETVSGGDERGDAYGSVVHHAEKSLVAQSFVGPKRADRRNE